VAGRVLDVSLDASFAAIPAFAITNGKLDGPLHAHRFSRPMADSASYCVPAVAVRARSGWSSSATSDLLVNLGTGGYRDPNLQLHCDRRTYAAAGPRPRRRRAGARGRCGPRRGLGSLRRAVHATRSGLRVRPTGRPGCASPGGSSAAGGRGDRLVLHPQTLTPRGGITLINCRLDGSYGRLEVTRSGLSRPLRLTQAAEDDISAILFKSRR
jgi:hypothetical protein